MSSARKSTPSFSSRPLVSPQLADSIRKWLTNWNIRSSGEQAPPKTDGKSITLDPGNRLTIVGAAFTIDSSGNITFKTGTSFTEAGGFTFQNNISLNGVFARYNSQITAGLALPYLVADPATSIGLVAASTNFINYTPASSVGKYLIFWSVDCTVATTDNFHVQITFKDASGNAINQTCGGFDKAGSALVAGAITNTIGTGVYYGFMIFSIDNSGTAITLSTAGTFTTVTYNLDASLYRLA